MITAGGLHESINEWISENILQHFANCFVAQGDELKDVSATQSSSRGASNGVAFDTWMSLDEDEDEVCFYLTTDRRVLALKFIRYL